MGKQKSWNDHFAAIEVLVAGGHALADGEEENAGYDFLTFC
jgi:hypothetical protein